MSRQSTFTATQSAHNQHDDIWALAPEPGMIARGVTEIVINTFFQAQHRTTIGGRLSDQHSHSYRLEVCFAVMTGASTSTPFHAIRTAVERVTKAYLGMYLNDLPPFRSVEPTTEYLAAVLFHQIHSMLRDVPARLTSLTVWESPTQGATYRMP